MCKTQIILALVCVQGVFQALAEDKRFIFHFQPAVKRFVLEGSVYITNAGLREAYVNVTTPLITSGLAMVSESITIPAESTHIVIVPEETILTNGVEIQNNGILIESSEAVAVQCLTVSNDRGDGFSVPPVEQLGSEYSAMSYRSTSPDFDATKSGEQGPYLIVVTATEDNTDVTVKVKTQLVGGTIFMYSEGMATYPRDSVIGPITLNKFQNIQFMSTYNDLGTNVGPSGSIIRGTKDIFVTSGTYQGSGYWYGYPAAIVESLAPGTMLGKLYFTAPIKYRTEANYIHVRGYEGSGVNIHVRSHDGTTLQNELRPEYAGLTEVTTQGLWIETDFNVSVATITPGFDATMIGSPSMVLHRPVNEWKASYIVYPMDNNRYSFDHHTVNLIIQATDISTLILNDMEFPALSWTPIHTTGYSWAHLDISPLQHHKICSTNGSTFSATLFGHRYSDSYGVPGVPTPGGIQCGAAVTTDTQYIATTPGAPVTAYQTGPSGIILRRAQIVTTIATAPIGTYPMRRLSQAAVQCVANLCLSMYVNTMTATCILYSDHRPNTLLDENNGWRFYKVI